MKLYVCLWNTWCGAGLVYSYLRGRKQCVVIDGSTSAWTEVGTGVPQGSIPTCILLSSLLTSWGSQRVSSQPVCRWYCYLLSRPWSKHPRKQNWKLTWDMIRVAEMNGLKLNISKSNGYEQEGQEESPNTVRAQVKGSELRMQDSVKYLEVEWSHLKTHIKKMKISVRIKYQWFVEQVPTYPATFVNFYIKHSSSPT